MKSIAQLQVDIRYTKCISCDIRISYKGTMRIRYRAHSYSSSAIIVILATPLIFTTPTKSFLMRGCFLSLTRPYWFTGVRRTSSPGTVCYGWNQSALMKCLIIITAASWRIQP
ncbi:uncharacterized protein ARMOST_17945 [Armillaria ostoyae]|uniref:Uncharacterized protein n=1 Tax=Armillaria ostoyae TaxID=47428 RepID=A0A284S0M5_ARMOS|nr:uncharacterized protein ARMOST_17945 [Armillaria ostoyae]